MKKLKKIYEVKEKINKLKKELEEGKISSSDIDLDEIIEQAKNVIEKEILYEATNLTKEILELFDEEIRLLGKSIIKPQIFLTLTLPMPEIASLPTLNLLEGKKEDSQRNQIDPYLTEEAITPPSISISKYDVESEKRDLLNRLEKLGEVSLSDWLLESIESDQYVVRIVALGSLLRDGKLIISRDGKIRFNDVHSMN